METKLPLEFFRQLPKTDLHVHLDGSLRLETILDLAEQDGIELPTRDPAELRRFMNLGQNCGSLVEYLKAFDVTLRVMQTEASLYRTAFELAEDAARENVRYMEVRYSPMLHGRQGLKMTAIVESVLAGLRAAQAKYGIESNVILCGIRNISPETSLEMAELCVAYKNRGVVAFDLAGAEYDHPAKHHRAAFQLVRDNNINVTIHAGEAYGPESIAQAIHICGAHRIGHGCRLRENGDLLHYVNDHRLPLECCPSSNVQTNAVRDLASHPLKLYQALGLRVTINTDNRLVTDTTVSRELWLCHTTMDISLRDIKSMILAGFKSSFLPFHIKQAYLRQVSQELKRFHEDGTIDDPPQPAPSGPNPPRLGRAPLLDPPDLSPPSLSLPLMTSILVVEDDQPIADAVLYALRRDGMAAEARGSLADARARLADPGVDLVILDLTLPDGSGFSLLDELRRADQAPRVIVLTSRDEDIDCVASLEAGADDYVTKPFSPRALVARVRAVLRRGASVAPPPAPATPQGPPPALEVDPERRRATWAGQEIPLTKIEFDLLAVLAEAPGRVRSRGQLVERVWGTSYALTERTVDSHFKGLRRKLEEAGAPATLIETVRGVGFKLREG